MDVREKHTDIAIVGAGILGLAHAYHAARAGLTVSVFERGESARGASVRNFGMLAIIAQAAGVEKESALRSLETWQHIARHAGVQLHHSGCLITALEPEELAVLHEFTCSDKRTSENTTFLTPVQLQQRFPLLQTDTLLGGLWCGDAWKVDQRQGLAKIAAWLEQEHEVSFNFSTEVKSVNPRNIETSNGKFECGNTIVCGGSEFATLFPGEFKASGVHTCQLQMFSFQPQPSSWQFQPFLLGGLSLARYAAFTDCESLPELVAMQQNRYKDYLEHGIHVIACQESDGSITVGDSHTYDPDHSDGRSDHIDELIQKQLSRMIKLPDTTIKHRWLGHYAHLPGTDVLKFSPLENVLAITMTNGQGMTHGFAIAEKVIADLVDA